MTRYTMDPRWIVARYSGTCASCAAPIAKGGRAFWFPKTRSLFCDKAACGRKESAEYEAAAADEDTYANLYPAGLRDELDEEWESERVWQQRMSYGCEPVEEPPYCDLCGTYHGDRESCEGDA